MLDTSHAFDSGHAAPSVEPFVINFFKSPLDFCLLIPCYNDEPGLIQSLQSIQYAPEKFAVVIVDDGSRTPVDMALLKSSAPNVTQFHLIRLPQNSGITTALNTGLHWILENATTPYIARLDCRDTCHPQRFYKQVTFLNTHTEVGLLGTWCTFTDEKGKNTYTYTTPLQHTAIINAMHLRNVFIHPTVMFRTAVMKEVGFYPYDFPHAEDYAFFWKLLKITQGAVLGESLMDCAVRNQGLSLLNRRVQLLSRKKAVQQFGTNSVLKVIGMLKLYILLIIPKSLLLRLKLGWGRK